MPNEKIFISIWTSIEKKLKYHIYIHLSNSGLLLGVIKYTEYTFLEKKKNRVENEQDSRN